ncbi:hypothetical protein M409DRAFT_28002 [Zasmidium cellare ATCC 36951]|uniref:Uncharacterized protein n=1 Tax=Zasmidium cellare ATCC 36951 TaxID=1080233 RepID=A0A6A6C5S2_ZASCE|nr:uncharacterized protein M409DRAFT_28002 [Zasmidium cellare ATCC 36951]KAF2161608.1 hypothetical protein M409DRAFT_28002 [Zasmidium cellare ATCC 36951]
MLAFPPSSSPHAFLPTIPSPLSPRSANIHGPTRHALAKTMTSQEGQQQETTKQEQEGEGNTNSLFKFDNINSPLCSNPNTTNTKHSPTTPFSHRPIKRAPTPQQNALKTQRRNAFLRKVRDERDQARYESRGEDFMRLEFVRRRREYEEELKRDAPTPSAEEEDAELPGWGDMDVAPEVEVEEFVKGEEEEMRALLENFPDEMMGMEEGDGDGTEGNLWSDDAEYDDLFREVLRSEEEEMLSAAGGHGGQGGGGEEMDMS